MDKYEFNIKVEQIKKLVNKGDFETAMKIADTIDWRRVRNANLLAMISQVYEKNGEYSEAKEVLLLAFERAPIGKRLLYKLTELALKEGSVKEAEDYYREFCDMAPDDSRQHLLRYMILKEKKASDAQLIHSLECYVSTELDEKWMYELASLYARANMVPECIQMCDRIMLMFGILPIFIWSISSIEKPEPFMLSNVFCIQSLQMLILFGILIILPAMCSGLRQM